MHLGLTITNLQDCAHVYDLLAMQVAYHEVAHAYINHIVLKPSATDVEKSGCEYIADLLATEWFYNKWIRNTPDADEYRRARGMVSYADTIVCNSLSAFHSQLAMLVLMAIAGAQRTGGVVSLAGGTSHPPGLQRCLLSHVHLYTMIASNFGKLLSPQQFQQLEKDWSGKMDVLVQAGVIPLADLQGLLDEGECDMTCPPKTGPVKM
jgi:hypothetical protein